MAEAQNPMVQIFLVIAGTLAVWLLYNKIDLPVWPTVTTIAVLIASAVFWSRIEKTRRRRQVFWVLFVLYILVAGGLSIVIRESEKQKFDSQVEASISEAVKDLNSNSADQRLNGIQSLEEAMGINNHYFWRVSELFVGHLRNMIPLNDETQKVAWGKNYEVRVTMAAWGRNNALEKHPTKDRLPDLSTLNFRELWSKDANYDGFYFANSDFSGAYFNYVSFKNSILTGAIFTGAKFENCKIDDSTIGFREALEKAGIANQCH